MLQNVFAVGAEECERKIGIVFPAHIRLSSFHHLASSPIMRPAYAGGMVGWRWGTIAQQGGGRELKEEGRKKQKENNCRPRVERMDAREMKIHG
jgi:hypothetical protein